MRRPLEYRDAMVNYYVKDVEGLAAFYRENFGFHETFRTPREGEPVHIEVRLGSFVLGFASIEAARSMHQLPLDPGLPRGEIALWSDDIDRVHATLTAKGVRCISPPHDFLGGRLRAAWFQDPEGNHIQVVAKVNAAE